MSSVGVSSVFRNRPDVLKKQMNTEALVAYELSRTAYNRYDFLMEIGMMANRRHEFLQETENIAIRIVEDANLQTAVQNAKTITVFVVALRHENSAPVYDLREVRKLITQNHLLREIL